jgi:hypothetical protein
MKRSKHEQPRRRRRFMCRCRNWKCQARVTLEKHPAAYRRRYSCEGCGRTSEYREDVLRVDWFRTSKAECRHNGVCLCRAAPFPHRAGSRFLGVRCDQRYAIPSGIVRRPEKRVAA